MSARALTFRPMWKLSAWLMQYYVSPLVPLFSPPPSLFTVPVLSAQHSTSMSISCSLFRAPPSSLSPHIAYCSPNDTDLCPNSISPHTDAAKNLWMANMTIARHCRCKEWLQEHLQHLLTKRRTDVSHRRHARWWCRQQPHQQARWCWQWMGASMVAEQGNPCPYPCTRVWVLVATGHGLGTTHRYQNPYGIEMRVFIKKVCIIKKGYVMYAGNWDGTA